MCNVLSNICIIYVTRGIVLISFIINHCYFKYCFNTLLRVMFINHLIIYMYTTTIATFLCASTFVLYSYYIAKHDF